MRELLNEHPIEVTAIGSFLAMQLATFAWLIYRLRADGKVLAQEGRPSPSESASQLPWVAWCLNEGMGSRIGPREAGREAAIAELDRRLGAWRSYLFLQRMALMAPLLGVLITASGFVNLELPENSAEVANILAAINPLVLGVGGGALLAFLNQFLLHFADTSVDVLRAQARSWYDNSFPASERSAAHGTPLEQQLHTAEALRQAAADSMQVASLVNGMSTADSDRAERWAGIMEDFAGRIGEVPARLAHLTDTMEGTVRTLNTLAPLVSQITNSFEGTTRSFRDSVEHGLAPLISHQNATAEGIGANIESSRKVLEDLIAGSSILREVADRQDEVTKSYAAVFESIILPQQQAFQSTATRIEAAVQGLASPVEGFLALLQGLSSSFATGEAGLQAIETGASAFASAVQDQFLPAAELHRNVLSTMASTSQDTKLVAVQLSQAAERLTQAAEAQRAASEQMRTSVEKHAVPAHALLERTVRQFDSSAEMLTEHADRYRSALLSHANGVSHLEQKVGQAVDAIAGAGRLLTDTAEKTLQEPLSLSKEVIAGFRNVSEHLEQSVANLVAGTDGVRRVADDQASVQGQLGAAMAECRQTAESLNAVVGLLRTSVEQHLGPTQQEVQKAAVQLTNSSEHLSGFMQKGVAPLTDRILELNASLVNVRMVLEDIGSMAAASRNAHRFLEAMEKAGKLAEALHALPIEIGEALRQSSFEGQGKDKKSRKWWFGSK